MKENELVGFNMNVSKDFIESAVRQTVMMGISESLNGKNEIASQIVNQVLSTKVDKNGKISSYDYDNKTTLLEYYVRNIIENEVKEEIKVVAEERREEIRDAIRKEFSKKSTMNSFIDSFLTSMENTLSSSYRTSVSVNFSTKKDED